MAKESLSIIIPTLNERDSINRLVFKILDVLTAVRVDVEVLVVDDSSSDGTAQTVQRAFHDIPRVRVVKRSTTRSLGASIKDGILAANHDLILIMDADFTHPPEDIPRLLSSMYRADMIVGSRFVRGGGMDRTWLYFLGRQFFNLICQSILGVKVLDVLSRFILLRRKDLLSLDINKIFYGYGDFAIRLQFAAKKMNWTVVEVPLNSPKRISGVSKTRSVKHAGQYILAAIKVRMFL